MYLTVSLALVGRKAALLDLMEETAVILHETESGSAHRTGLQSISDQFHFNEAMALAFKRNHTLAVTDTESRIFQVMIHSYHDIRKISVGEVRRAGISQDQDSLFLADWETWANRPISFNYFARRVPALIHFAGPKSEIDGEWEKMWWNVLEGPDSEEPWEFLAVLKERNMPVATLPNGTSVRWATLCGEFEDYI